MPSSTASAQNFLLMRYGVALPLDWKCLFVNCFYTTACHDERVFLVWMSISWLLCPLLGVLNMLVTAAFCCTILIFAMVRLTSISNLVFISVLLGYFFGIGLCKWCRNKISVLGFLYFLNKIKISYFFSHSSSSSAHWNSHTRCIWTWIRCAYYSH